MWNKFSKFVMAQPLLIAIGMGVLALGGIWSWRHLPIDAFPDVTSVQVMVLTEVPGLAPEDVEQQVTYPIELALQGLPDVRQLRSLSKAALSQVILVFEDHVDIYFARQLVFERLESARESLPPQVEPEMGPISTGLGEIFQYTLESEDKGAMELRTIQDWLVAPQLRAISGVNEVNSFGGFVKQYHILVDPDRLLKYQLTLDEVLAAVNHNNANAGGNFLVKGWEQSYVRSVGLIKSISDLRKIVLTAKDGTPVFLENVADVAIGHQTRQGAVTRDGEGETVAGMVIMLRGENSKEVVERVKQAIPKIQNSLPEGVHIKPFYDRTSLIDACIHTVSGALMQGGIFVILVLFLLLGNLRTALVVACSLPFTAFWTFIFMDAQHVTANLMSLGGLAIAIGMIVDASIVVAENITRHLGRVKDPTSAARKRAIREAIVEVARPIVFAVAIIILVFIPLFTLEQMEGKMFKPMALTLCFAMFGSLITAFTVAPILSYWLGRRVTRDGETALTRGIKHAYLALLQRALAHKKSTLTLAGTLLLGALTLIPMMGTEFLPPLDEGAIAINVVRLPSASLEGSVAVGTLIEKKLMKYPEVETIVTKTGRAEISEDPMGPEQNDVFVMLHPQSEWPTGRSKTDLLADIERDLKTIPGIRPSFSQPIALRVNELISGIKSDLAVRIFGPDLAVLKDQATTVADILSGIQGAEDVKVEQISGFSQLEIRVDRDAMARMKINVADINDVVETAIGGKVATTIVEGEKRFAALVRLPESARSSQEAIARILVPSPLGARVPLSQLAHIVEVEAPAQISREQGMRRVVVECNIRGRDMGSFVHEAQDALQDLESQLPAGYRLNFGGQFENQQRAMNRLAVVVPISVALILLMLFSAFGSLRQALLVLANLPFALVGGIFAIVLSQIYLSVSAAIGFIALFGMAVENGTLLITFFNQLRERGLNVFDAVKQGCEMRFRPLLMTAMTTLLGLSPMLYATGSGSEIQRPLAIVVLGGLATSLLLTLLVLPVLYLTVESRHSGQ